MKHNLHIEDVSRETIKSIQQAYISNSETFDIYVDLLLWWNKKINLVSRGISKEELKFHVEHCLYIEPLLRNGSVLDIGTGGGLPGIPLAILREDLSFVLNDKVAKKMLAVNDMLRKLKLTNVETVAGRIEEVSLNRGNINVVSKHAFKLNDMLSLTKHIDVNEYVILKGEDFLEELHHLNSPLTIKAFNLSTIDPFYKGKYILQISKPFEQS